jgi:signal transduction histidine kinase
MRIVCAPATSTGVPSDSSEERGPHDRARGRRRQDILVVEDEPDVAGAVADVLRSEGYDVQIARHGQEALDRLQTQLFDLILLDLRLPVMDGWKFRTIQRSHPRLSRIPVIAVSADASPQAEAIDAEYYLRKPLDAHQLLVAVERVLLAERRKQLDEQLKEAGLLTTLGTIAATVGHEINNPLTYVMGNLQLLQSRLALVRQRVGRQVEAELFGEIGDMLKDVRVGADRIREVVSTLQGMSQSPEVTTSPVDMVAVARSSIAMAWNEIRHRAPLRTDLQPVPPVMGNEVRLGQVVINLLRNAAQSIPAGAYESNEIRVSTSVQGDQVIVEVTDTGVGIPPDLQARVFDPFFTTKGKVKGTGIGLTVSRNIVLEHGGQMDLRSRPGAGTTFRVSLLARRDGDTTTLGAADPEAPSGPPPPATEKALSRVLVVDDDPLVLAAMARMLAQEFGVEKATSPREALALLSSRPRFDVVVCDVVMPEMTGMQFCAEAEHLQPGVSDSMVFVTGAVLMPEVQAFREQSQHAWVEKPFSLQDLLGAVRKAADAAHAAQVH